MSLNNDYAANLINNSRLQEFRAEAANDRLARIAQGDRVPWWRRLFLPANGARPINIAGSPVNRKVSDHGLRVGAHHVAR